LPNNKNLTRKQYCSRITQMTRRGLVTRENGKLFLTSLGKIAYRSVMKIDYAVANYWRLKAIDSMQDLKEMSRDERHRIIKTIVGNDKTMQNIFENQYSTAQI
jgi:hypothetical protein